MLTSTFQSNTLKIKNMIDDSIIPHSLSPNTQNLISISYDPTYLKMIIYYFTYCYLLNSVIAYLLSQFFRISSV
jgi:hypothetical protein